MWSSERSQHLESAFLGVTNTSWTPMAVTRGVLPMWMFMFSVGLWFISTTSSENSSSVGSLFPIVLFTLEGQFRSQYFPSGLERTDGLSEGSDLSQIPLRVCRGSTLCKTGWGWRKSVALFSTVKKFPGVQDMHGDLRGITKVTVKPFWRAFCREILTILFYSLKLYLKRKEQKRRYLQSVWFLIFIKCSSYLH